MVSVLFIIMLHFVTKLAYIKIFSENEVVSASTVVSNEAEIIKRDISRSRRAVKVMLGEQAAQVI